MVKLVFPSTLIIPHLLTQRDKVYNKAMKKSIKLKFGKALNVPRKGSYAPTIAALKKIRVAKGKTPKVGKMSSYPYISRPR